MSHYRPGPRRRVFCEKHRWRGGTDKRAKSYDSNNPYRIQPPMQRAIRIQATLSMTDDRRRLESYASHSLGIARYERDRGNEEKYREAMATVAACALRAIEVTS